MVEKLEEVEATVLFPLRKEHLESPAAVQKKVRNETRHHPQV
jgi:hypothetical protein